MGDDVIAGGATKIFTNAPAGRVLLGYPAVKMETHIEMQKALRRLPRLAAAVAPCRKPFQSRPRPTKSRSEHRPGVVMGQSVQDRVIAIIAEQAVLDVKDVKPDSTLESLGIDSLGLVESIFAIEEAFDISVPFNANDPKDSEFDISSVASIVAAVEALVADQSAGGDSSRNEQGRHHRRRHDQRACP